MTALGSAETTISEPGYGNHGAEQIEAARRNRRGRPRAVTVDDPAQWTYRDELDRMRGTTLRIAQLSSLESVELPFPYSGGTRGVLALRKNGAFRQVTLQATNGRFSIIGDSFAIRTRADSGLIQTWRANLSTNNDFSIVAIRQAAPFVRIMSSAREFIVEAELHGAGRRQFVFSPEGLDRRFLS